MIARSLLRLAAASQAKGASSPAPRPSPGVPHGPLARWLLNPGATQRRWLHEALAWLSAVGRAVVPVIIELAATALALVVLALVVRVLAARRVAAGARWVAIAPPAEVDLTGGLAWWRLLAPLLTSARGWTGRRPPVGLEFIASAHGTRIGLWISPTLSPDAVARTVQTAWPGARVTLGEPPLPLPAGARVTGARLRLAAPEWFPLGAGTDTTDPLRGVLSALAASLDGETAVLQVLARPAARRRLARARRAAWATRTGRPASRTGRLLDSLHGQRGPTQRADTADPFRLEDFREITSKAADRPHFQVTVRYAVAGGGAGGRRRRRGRCRELASGFGLYAGRNALVARRQARERRTLASRRLSGAFLCSAGELAALAHLPADPTRYRISLAPAHLVAPIPEVHHG